MSGTPVHAVGMLGGYVLPEYAFVVPPELAGGTQADGERVPASPVGRYPVVILGAGLAGLTLLFGAACFRRDA